MPITKDGNGVIQYTPASDRFETSITGTHPADSIAICDNQDQLKQIKFDPSSQATNSNVIFKTQNAAAGTDVVITFPNTSTDLSGSVEGFTIFQCDAGTSPTADVVNDTLTLTCTDSTLVITGNSTTDTVTFSAGSNLALLGGRSGGQTFKGDTASGGNLILMSTAHATKGGVTIGTTFKYDEANQRLLLGDYDGTGNAKANHLYIKAAIDDSDTLIRLEGQGSLGTRLWDLGVSAAGYLAFSNPSITSHFPFVLDNGGRASIGAFGSFGPMVHVKPSDVGVIGINATRFSSGQTADLLTVSDESNVAMFAVNKDGRIKNALAGNETTGAGSALLGANSPAVTNSAPYTWLKVITSDGSAGFVPIWK